MLPVANTSDGNYRELPVIRFLSQVQSPEYVALIVDALRILDGIGEERHKLTIDTYLATASQYDNSDLANFIIGTILDVLHTDLLPFGLKIDSETPIPVVTGLYETLIGLESYIDPQQVVTICDDDNSDNVEKLGRILSLFTDFGPTQIDEHIIEVSASLFQRIRDMASDMAIERELQDEHEPLQFYGQRCKAYAEAYLVNRFNIYHHLTANGYTFGLSPETYFREMKNKLLTISVNDISRNIIALGLASTMAFEDVEVTQKQLSRIIEGMISDSFMLSKISGEVNALLTKMKSDSSLLFSNIL